jgi:P27 family predicted phage terminase small subunit
MEKTSGPRPTPSEILKKRGSWRAAARDGDVVATRVRRLPPAPAWLGKIARAEWRRVTRLLDGIQLLFEHDLQLLALYCQELQVYVEAQASIKEHGLVVEIYKTETDEETGRISYGALKEIRKNPARAVAAQAAVNVKVLAAEFGLSPSARVGLRNPISKTSEPEIIDKGRFF